MPRLEIIRSTPDQRRAQDWTLALSSQGIGNGLEKARGEWHLSVAEENAARAREVLDAFERENAPPPPEPALPPLYGRTNAGFALAIALIAFFWVTGPRDFSVDWFARGSADAAAILGGEIWRTVTALTLHADLPHVLGNALSCALFATAVCHTYGPGAGSALMLLGGAGGNLVNALYHGSHHSSVGASTALFAAIGILAGTQFARRRSRRRERARAWIPLAGALGLVAMLGTSERADVFAHLFGLLVGTGLGIAAGFGLRRPPPNRAQYLLGAAALACLGTAWAVAFEGV